MAMPYLDFNKKGNGYYSIDERKFSYLTFQFGFFELWITLIILGTFLRGPTGTSSARSSTGRRTRSRCSTTSICRRCSG